MKAIVLCAGHGTRLGDLTREIPKPMLTIEGRPILDYILCNLRTHGFDEIAINLHFKPEIIKDHFGDGSKWLAKITYSFETELLGTAGAVKKIESQFLREDAFLVHYGDIVTDQDLRAMWMFHIEKHALVTMLVHRRKRSNSVVRMDSQNRVVEFLERPSAEEWAKVELVWVNSGICICSPSVLKDIPPGKVCDWPRDIFPRLVPTGMFFGFALTGYRCAVDSVERLGEVQTTLRQRKCRILDPVQLGLQTDL